MVLRVPPNLPIIAPRRLGEGGAIDGGHPRIIAAHPDSFFSLQPVLRQEELREPERDPVGSRHHRQVRLFPLAGGSAHPLVPSSERAASLDRDSWGGLAGAFSRMFSIAAGVQIIP